MSQKSFKVLPADLSIAAILKYWSFDILLNCCIETFSVATDYPGVEKESERFGKSMSFENQDALENFGETLNLGRLS